MNRRSFMGFVLGTIGSVPFITKEVKVKDASKAIQLHRIAQIFTCSLPVLQRHKIAVLTSKGELLYLPNTKNIDRDLENLILKIETQDLTVTQAITSTAYVLLSPDNVKIRTFYLSNHVPMLPGDTLKGRITFDAGVNLQ